jgi:hypothetical protein
MHFLGQSLQLLSAKLAKFQAWTALNYDKMIQNVDMCWPCWQVPRDPSTPPSRASGDRTGQTGQTSIDHQQLLRFPGSLTPLVGPPVGPPVGPVRSWPRHRTTGNRNWWHRDCRDRRDPHRASCASCAPGDALEPLRKLKASAKDSLVFLLGISS